MTKDTLSPADALREVARTIEHGCEFNVSRTLRWSAARQAENNRLVGQSRELYARADALDRPAQSIPSAQDELRDALRCTPPGFTLADMGG